MISHKSPISGIAAHKTGYVLTAGYDNQLILWDSMKHESLSVGHHDHLVNQCSFSPCGRYAASSSSDYTARIWDVPEMRLRSILNGHDDDIEGIVFHPTLDLIATCSRDGTIGIYDLNGVSLQRLHGHTADVISIQWENESHILISSSDDGTLKRWDAHIGKMIEDIDLGGVETDSVILTRNGTVLAGNDEGEIVFIGQQGVSKTRAHEAGIKKILCDSTTGKIITLSYDRTVKVWELNDNVLELVKEGSIPKYVWPRSCVFISESKLAFSTFGDRYAIFDVDLNQWDNNNIQDTFGINAVCVHLGKKYSVGDAGIVSVDGEEQYRLGSLCNFINTYHGHVIAGGQTGEVFDVESEKSIYQHRSPLNCSCRVQTAQGEKFVVGSYTGEVIVFSTSPDGAVECERVIKIHPNAIKGVCAAGSMLFSVCADSSACYYDLDKLKVMSYIEQAHDKIANGCASADNHTCLSISRDLKLRIWKEKNCLEVQTPSMNSIKCVSISDDGQYGCIGTYVGCLGIIDLERQEWVSWKRITKSGISSVVYHDGVFIASSYDGKLYSAPVESLCEV